MFTKESLRAQADEAEKRYKALLALHPPGTVHDGRNQAYDEMERARLCADWLEVHGIDNVADVGPFMTTELKRGDRVRIRKGARVFGTGSGIPREGEVIARARVVEVRDFYRGYINRNVGEKWRDGREAPHIVQGRIHWSGTNGYWRWTDIENVELVKACGRAA